MNSRFRSFAFAGLILCALRVSTAHAAAPDSTWKAWTETPTGGIHVTGSVIAPSRRYVVHMVAAAPQGQNARVFTLNLTLEKLPGTGRVVKTRIPASYDDDKDSGAYDSVAVFSVDRIIATMPVVVRQARWQAKADTLKHELRVTGEVEAPDPGYDARLKPAQTQGVNADDYLLDVALTRKKGNWTQVVTWIPVSYVESPYAGHHKTVTLHSPKGVVATVPVQVGP